MVTAPSQHGRCRGNRRGNRRLETSRPAKSQRSGKWRAYAMSPFSTTQTGLEESEMKTLLLALTSLAVVAGPAWSQQASRLPSQNTSAVPVVVSSTGQVIGRFVSGADSTIAASVLVSYNNQVTSFALTSPGTPGLAWAYVGAVFFTTNNCTGQAYVIGSYSVTKIVGVALVVGSQSLGFVQSGNPQSINFQSLFNNDGSCNVTSGNATMQPAITINLPNPPLYVQ